MRGRPEESGFSLIEMMVVVMILAVLVGLAIPTFLGSRTAAEDVAAQGAVRDVLLAEKAYYLDNEAFTGDAAAIRAIEPNAALHATNPALGVVIVFPPARTDIVCLTRTSESDAVFAIWEGVVGGTHYGTTGLSTCPTSVPAGFSSSGW